MVCVVPACQLSPPSGVSTVILPSNISKLASEKSEIDELSTLDILTLYFVPAEVPIGISQLNEPLLGVEGVISKSKDPLSYSLIFTFPEILSVHLIVCKVPARQLSPPLGTVTIISFESVKFASEKSKMFPSLTLEILIL